MCGCVTSILVHVCEYVLFCIRPFVFTVVLFALYSRPSAVFHLRHFFLKHETVGKKSRRSINKKLTKQGYTKVAQNLGPHKEA